MIARENERAAKQEALTREVLSGMAGNTAALHRLAAAVEEPPRG